MGAWKNFTADHLESIRKVLPPVGESAPAQDCPSCGNTALRWYAYDNPFRVRSKITYVWCSSCRHYYGETTATQEWDLPDPLAGSNAGERKAMENDLGSFFAQLDEFWQSGQLPQVRPPHQRRLRSVRRG